MNLLLVCILLGNSMIIYGKENASVDGGDSFPPFGEGTHWVPEPGAARFEKTWQGYRFYAAVAYRNITTGNYDYADIIQTKYGTDCIDLIGSGFEKYPIVPNLNRNELRPER